MDVLTVDVREIDDHYPEYAEPFEPTGQGRHHGALSWQGGQDGALSWQLRHYGARPWGLAVGLVLILLTALLSRPPVPVPPPGPEPPIIIPEPEPEPEPTPVPPDDPVIPPDEPDEPPEPPVTVRHTVTFVDWDGTLLSSRQYDEGTAASSIVRPATPTRPSDGSYTYTFAGWTPAITAVTANATYTATYTATPVPVQYTVTFVNWDSSVISSAKYDEGTPASSIVVPADPTRPSDGSYKYIFNGWTPSLEPVTADATYTAVYLAEELPTYDLPEVDIEHEIYYWEGADEYFADFTASVTLKDVAGCTGQLKLMHYDDFTDAWEWAEFTGEDGVSYGNYYVLVKLYTVKDGVRTEFTPSDLNAPYDIPDDAEGLEADISWWFPWYVDDDDNFLPRVRETLNLEFDYTLPNGESGTVSLENDFHLYKDWFFGWGDTAVLDETAKTITIEVPYQVDYGGPLNYDNVYWHCHLYWQPEDDYHWSEKGTELEITPTVTTVTREDGTVAARIVYTLDEVVPGRLYDFYADVIYSDYGVDDADYWNNWVETYDATHMSF